MKGVISNGMKERLFSGHFRMWHLDAKAISERSLGLGQETASLLPSQTKVFSRLIGRTKQILVGSFE